MSVRFDLLLKKWKLKTKPMIQWTGEQNSFSVAETSTLSFDFQLKEELLKAQITNISRTEIKWYDDISVDNKTGSNYLTFLLNISNIHLILYLILFITLMTVINLLIACMIKRCCNCCKNLYCKNNCCKKLCCWVNLTKIKINLIIF